MKMKKLLQNAIKRNFKARTSQGFHVSLRFAQNNSYKQYIFFNIEARLNSYMFYFIFVIVT